MNQAYKPIIRFSGNAGARFRLPYAIVVASTRLSNDKDEDYQQLARARARISFTPR